MNTFQRKLFISLLSLSVDVSAQATWRTVLPETMIAITSDARPLARTQRVATLLEQHGNSLQVYNLDAVDRFEAAMSRGLPANEAQARHLFASRVRGLGQENFEQRLITAYGGVVKAMQYRIERYPIIIFDQQFTIYGVTNLQIALETYQRYLADGDRQRD